MNVDTRRRKRVAANAALAGVVVVGAVVTLVVWIVSAVWGLSLPEPVVAAITTILAAVAARVVPSDEPV